MTKQAYIFIGKSGCGKGTQAKLLNAFLEEQGRPIFYFETGAAFREFAKTDGYSQNLVKTVGETGGLQPEFLAVLMWASALAKNLTGGETLVLDGSPRKLIEAEMLDSAFNFYNFEKPTVIFLNVSREWSEARLLARGRGDDDKVEIGKRLDWYDTEVNPVIDWYKNNSKYNFVDINGEQTIEEVQQEIIAKVFSE